MTEHDWLAATDPGLILRFLWPRRPSERKRRLFEVACCHRVWDAITDPDCRAAVVVAERFADGLVTDTELEEAANRADVVWVAEIDQLRNAGVPDDDFGGALDPPLMSGVGYNVAVPIGYWGGAPAFEPPSRIIRTAATDPAREGESQAVLLRDILGNPFRPVAVEPAWRTEAVVALARGIYDDRAFDRLPVLADALDDAGCTNADLLTHCRSPGPHVRGCWAIDLLLWKS